MKRGFNVCMRMNGKLFKPYIYSRLNYCLKILSCIYVRVKLFHLNILNEFNYFLSKGTYSTEEKIQFRKR